MASDPRSLIPRASDGYLQQQGSIDWVKLGGSTVNFAVEFLVRLSNGGVEPLTVCAAETILSRLRLGHHGEIRVQEAVTNLKAFSSFNKALWFGFGVKHVIRQLAESTQGLNCIAVCAAMSESYSILDTARILQELLRMFNAPSRLTPSLRQWMSLTNMCAGALANTDFGVILHKITRLCIPDGFPSLRFGSEPAAIAKALNGVIMVSNGSLDKVQVVGGADCGWIAAFSVWLLDLTVEVRNESGQILYSSVPEPDHPRDPQVLIIYGTSTADIHLTGKTCVIPSGRLLIREDIVAESGIGSTMSYGRVPWESILEDTFGVPMKSLLGAGLSINCGTALGCAARIFMAGTTCEPGIPVTAYQINSPYISSSSHGKGFVITIRQNLPELSRLEPLMDAMESSLECAFTDAVGRYDQALQLITAACDCPICNRDSSIDGDVLPLEQPFCQPVLVEVIIDLVLIISSLSTATDVLPARSGVENIYWHRTWPKPKEAKSYVYDSLLRNRYAPPFISAKDLFAGRAPRQVSVFDSAIAYSGLCFVIDALFNVSANQDQCSRIHVVPGRIEWGEHIFDEISDAEPRKPTYLHNLGYEANIGLSALSISCCTLRDTTSPDIFCELLVEENGHSPTNKLNAMYRISTSKGRFLVGPSSIQNDIKRAINPKDCKGRECGSLPPFDIVPIEGEGLLVNRDNLPELISIPLVRVLVQNIPAQWVAVMQESILTAQEMLTARERYDSPLWYKSNVRIILQDRQCLHCLLTSVVRGPWTDKHHETPKRNVCIVTSLNGNSQAALQARR